MLEASKLHSPLQAPIMVCISSIKRRTSFSALLASSITCLILVSNSPLNFVPATRDDISRERIRLSFIENGTSHFAILRASHSTIAVFPTQASHTKHGLFFVFLLSIAISRSISVSLPIMTSILPSRASAVRSVEKKSRAGVLDSSFLSSITGFASNGRSHSDSSFPPCKLEKILSARFQNSFSIEESEVSSSRICPLSQSIVPTLIRSFMFVSTSLGLIPIYSKKLASQISFIRSDKSKSSKLALAFVFCAAIFTLQSIISLHFWCIPLYTHFLFNGATLNSHLLMISKVSFLSIP